MIARVLTRLGGAWGLRLRGFACGSLWLNILLIFGYLKMGDLLVELVFRWTGAGLLIGSEDVGQWLVKIVSKLFPSSNGMTYSSRS